MEENDKKKVNKQTLYAILGVLLLIVVVVGVTYAYYMARRTAVFNGVTAGSVKLEVELASTNANKSLFPIDDSIENLTSKATGEYTGNLSNLSATFIREASDVFIPERSCLSQSGASACQLYAVRVINHSDADLTLNIGVTSLVGASAPNIDVIKIGISEIDSNGWQRITIANNTSIKGNASGIASNLSVPKGTTTDTYYILVFVRNNPNGQSDTGTFSGVVTAATVSGPALPNDGVVTAEF